LKERTTLLKIVAESYTDDVLAEALERFGIDPASAALINSNTDVVFNVEQGEKQCILKLVHSSQANSDLVRGEVEWVNYLASHGAAVARPIYSYEGNFLEVIETKPTYFSAVLYEKAPGVRIGYEEDQHNAPLFERCGQVVGQMHRLAKGYHPPSPAFKRPDYREIILKEKFPPELDHVYDIHMSLMGHLATLPREREGFGITHGDFHAFNFFVDGEKITVFDFGECHYTWFAFDIAVVLYHVLDLPYPGLDYDEFSGFFMEWFMKGYARENTLEKRWEAEMETFLRLREIRIYNYIYTEWDWKDHDDDRKWMEAARKRIESGQPITTIPFHFG
jgi:Ser/Thr protein kinase RdoA (MazF antagonist)